MNQYIKLLFLIFILTFITSEEIFEINLDLPPTQRYLELARAKKQSIQSFIDYLKATVPKYKMTFNVVDKLYSLSPSWLKQKVGAQFYQQCQSVATGAQLPLSEIIVFNYMYELGAATDFCTAITISDGQQKLLGRNLDYGYQQFLVSNSVQIKYLSKGKVLFQTLGHSGFVGTHTVLKRATQNDPYQYGLVLNEREQGGLHLTLQKMAKSRCQTSPYAIMKTLKYCKGDVKAVVQHLNSFDTCAAVYYTIIGQSGESYVIQKNRGVGSNKIRSSAAMNSINFIVQTNHDSDTADPDGRSTAAADKLKAAIQSNRLVNSSDIWSILTQKPNFNSLTLMSGIIDVEKGEIYHQVWEKSDIS